MNITIKMSCIGIMVIAMMIIPTTNVIMTQDESDNQITVTT